MTDIIPIGGTTHHLAIKHGPPDSPSYQGIMLPNGDLKKYVVQPYTPFAPQSRQGEKKIEDFNVATVWELNADFAGGTGHTREQKVQTGMYALSQGNNVTGGLGTTLFTGQRGKLLPAPAHATANTGGAIAAGNIKQYIEFKSRLYGLSDENPGKIYQWDATGVTPTLVETLSTTTNTTGVQLFTDGATLYCTRGSTRLVRTTTDGTTWGNHATISADYLAIRENGTLCYMVGATFYPGGSEGYTSPKTIGWSGNNVTNLAVMRGAVVIGKPEGLFIWIQDRVEEKYPVHDAVDTTNFSKMTVHNNVLWFNFKNRLFFTDLESVTEVYPADRGGFTTIYCITGTSGPLLLGAKWASSDASATYSGPRSVTTPASDLTDDSSIGSVAWTNPENAGTSNNSYATAILPAGGYTATHYLKALNFGFAIPTSASITGIMVEAEAKVSDTGRIYGRIVKAGSVLLSSFNADLTTSDAYYPFGNSGELWGTTWSPGDINAATFGVAFYASKATSATQTISIDHIRITVYYTAGGASQNCLFMLESVQDAGLNPLWTDADGSNPMYAAYATSAPDATASRIYTSSDNANWKQRYIDLDTRYTPKTFDTGASNISYIELTEFSSGFASIKKWWYQLVLNAVTPNQTTFAKSFYSIDGANFTQTEDYTGAVVEHTLNTRSVGSYFPLNTVGTYNQLRIYLRTTTTTGPAAITTVTLRGDVMVKPRFQFQFPVDCEETVNDLNGNAENGNAIFSNLKTASQQGYPCKLQDPEGNWHLVQFQTSPYFAIADYRTPQGANGLIPFGTATVVLLEVDALPDGTNFTDWVPG